MGLRGWWLSCSEHEARGTAYFLWMLRTAWHVRIPPPPVLTDMRPVIGADGQPVLGADGQPMMAPAALLERAGLLTATPAGASAETHGGLSASDGADLIRSLTEASGDGERAGRTSIDGPGRLDGGAPVLPGGATDVERDDAPAAASKEEFITKIVCWCRSETSKPELLPPDTVWFGEDDSVFSKTLVLAPRTRQPRRERRLCWWWEEGFVLISRGSFRAQVEVWSDSDRGTVFSGSGG